MADTIIKVENVSKQYRLGVVGTGTLSHDLNRWWHAMRGKEDPYLKIGEENNRASTGSSEYVWALKDINFEVKQGEVLGIIGKNGAGKSTLLKLLSRVTTPTTGEIKAKGRIASLLEVGTGFHEELTGRENIFLNGAILGMTKAEIRSKLDEIIDFSGTERYIDTPVKRYSSGMRVRLAFAVAAHLDPEILIVDEVLAVGDAEFQKKAIGKMQDVSRGQGRTVLFVSHNMNAVRNLCTSGVILENGKINFVGDIENTIKKYENLSFKETHLNLNYQSEIEKDIPFQIQRIQVMDRSGSPKPVFDMFESVIIKMNYIIRKDLKGSLINFSVNNALNTIFLSFDSDENLKFLDYRPEGSYEAMVEIPAGLLKPDHYFLHFTTGIANVAVMEKLDKAVGFKVELQSKNDSYLSYAEKRPGVIAMPLVWKTLKTLK